MNVFPFLTWWIWRLVATATKQKVAPGEARTLDLRITSIHTAYKYDARTDCATGAMQRLCWECESYYHHLCSLKYSWNTSVVFSCYFNRRKMWRRACQTSLPKKHLNKVYDIVYYHTNQAKGTEQIITLHFSASTSYYGRPVIHKIVAHVCAECYSLLCHRFLLLDNWGSPSVRATF